MRAYLLTKHLFSYGARLAALACLLSVGCSRTGHSTKGAEDAGVAPPVSVDLVTLATGPLENALRFSANLEAEIHVQVLARAPGHVESVLVEEGDLVKKNQVLLRLDDAEQKSAAKAAQSQLEQAQRTFRRQVELREHGVISDDLREKAEFDRKQLEIAYEDAKRNLKYTVVRAPVAGTVTLRKVKLGDYVNPNQHLFDVTDFASVVAKVFVPERDALTVRKGQRVRLFSLATKDEARTAVVERIAPVVDPRTGTAKVTIAIPDTSDLRPGAYVSVELVTASKDNAVLLPRKALVYEDEQPFAFKLAKDNRVQRIRVVPTLQGRDAMEAEGFVAGDKVVVAGQVGLKDGALVAPSEKGAASAAKSEPSAESAR